MASRKLTDFVQFKLRIREELRRKLEREATKRHHSTNNEAVLRLEHSFASEAGIDEALGGAEQAALLRGFAAEIDYVKAKRGTEFDNNEAARLLARAFRNVAEKLIPDLHSVRVARLGEGLEGDGASGTAFSDRGFAAWSAAHPEFPQPKP
jgi:hypothetical protein